MSGKTSGRQDDQGRPPERLYSLSEATKLLPVPRTAHSVYRWATEGVKTRGGKRVKLKTVFFGTRRYVRQQDIHEFFERLNDEELIQ